MPSRKVVISLPLSDRLPGFSFFSPSFSRPFPFRSRDFLPGARHPIEEDEPSSRFALQSFLLHPLCPTLQLPSDGPIEKCGPPFALPSLFLLTFGKATGLFFFTPTGSTFVFSLPGAPCPPFSSFHFHCFTFPPFFLG